MHQANQPNLDPLLCVKLLHHSPLWNQWFLLKAFPTAIGRIHSSVSWCIASFQLLQGSSQATIWYWVPNLSQRNRIAKVYIDEGLLGLPRITRIHHVLPHTDLKARFRWLKLMQTLSRYGSLSHVYGDVEPCWLEGPDNGEGWEQGQWEIVGAGDLTETQ